MWQQLKNLYHALVGLLVATWYGFPGKKLIVVGVTGTDGKTTTTHLIYHILTASGKKAALVSSVYAEIAGKTHETGFHVTNPDPWLLQRLLKEAVRHGDEYMVLEVTSHGLDQHRIFGIPFAIGVITNVTHEHLDYHKTYLAYLKTKEKLLLYAKKAIVNKDDKSYRYFSGQVHAKEITYAIKQAADVTPKSFPFTTVLPGTYNQYNCLAAITTVRALGIPETDIRRALRTFPGVKGRFEYIRTGKDFNLIIDFAHTPNAIDQVLSTLRPLVKGKIIHVFGAAGLRDFTKRSAMGETSAKYADIIVLTEEDFRTEDINQIIAQIAQGVSKSGGKEFGVDQYLQGLKTKWPVFFRIPNRAQAINLAIQKLARRGDTVILTGKAHEKSLCRGTVEYPWSEHTAVKNALKL